MNNNTFCAVAKLLKIGFCGFCYYVRVRGGKAQPHTRAGTHWLIPVHNNKSNNIIFYIYIIGIEERFCDRLGFCA